MAKGRGRQGSNQRADSKNPNNPSHQASMDNRANQLNPQHSAYHSSRRGGGFTMDYDDEVVEMSSGSKIIPFNVSEANVKKLTIVYQAILERTPSIADLSYFGRQLQNSQKTTRDIVKILSKSDEYQSRFINSVTPQEAVRLMYRHFLGREPENELVVNAHLGYLGELGWQGIIEVFTDSEEYRSRFGEDEIPVVQSNISPKVKSRIAVHSEIEQVHLAVGSILGGVEKSTVTDVWIARQLFQNGQMFWREDSGEIYVLFNTRKWQKPEFVWQEIKTDLGSDELNQSLALLQGGFGKIWTNELDVRRRLGKPLNNEWGFEGNIQDYQNGGVIIQTNLAEFFVLIPSEDWISR